MTVETHQLDDSCELLEVLPLRSSQRVLSEERDDDVPKVTDPLHAVSKEILSMIVVSTVSEDLAASEESDEFVKHIPTRRALDNSKLRSDLPSEAHLRAAEDGTAEAAFSVYKPYDPAKLSESFLLVFRTRCIVTARSHGRA